MENSLYNAEGHRLYINSEERQALIIAAGKAKRENKCFCNILIFTGCRISEALEITPRHINLAENSITIRSLKKRGGKIIYRTVPVPSETIELLDMVYGIRELQTADKGLDALIWAWSRSKGWYTIKNLMRAAKVQDGAHMTAKGLRHGFGVHAMKCGIQLNMLQKWLGHSSPETTAIYANALGEEERTIAARMWE